MRHRRPPPVPTGSEHRAHLPVASHLQERGPGFPRAASCPCCRLLLAGWTRHRKGWSLEKCLGTRGDGCATASASPFSFQKQAHGPQATLSQCLLSAQGTHQPGGADGPGHLLLQAPQGLRRADTGENCWCERSPHQNSSQTCFPSWRRFQKTQSPGPGPSSGDLILGSVDFFALF